jgi:hypothetical protein
MKRSKLLIKAMTIQKISMIAQISLVRNFIAAAMTARNAVETTNADVRVQLPLKTVLRTSKVV